MKHVPQDNLLQKYIDHYWIINDIDKTFPPSNAIYAYPGVKPELIIILDGSINFHYKNKGYSINKSVLFSHLEDLVLWHPYSLCSAVLVQFKPRSVSSLLPFLDVKATDLIKQCTIKADELFGDRFNVFVQYLRTLPTSAIPKALDNWFAQKIDAKITGFITEILEEDNFFNLEKIKKKTKYSESTFLRYFRKETGLTPKQFQCLYRYKFAVEEIYDTHNTDWIHYVEKYNYFDQSHFIKEIKRFTGFTPVQLLQTPGLLHFRPKDATSKHHF